VTKIAVILSCLLIALVGATAQTGAGRPAPKAATAKKSPATSGAKKSTGKAAATTQRWTPKTSRGTSSRRGRSTPRVYAQQQPTPDRYREIQKALIGKGYLQGEANGKWGAESTDALRRFQEAQNIEPADGKLNSLSLIALGLGPKRTSSVQARPSP
jgi:hypothetical protein